jgi:hypothetical protein
MKVRIGGCHDRSRVVGRGPERGPKDARPAGTTQLQAVEKRVLAESYPRWTRALPYTLNNNASRSVATPAPAAPGLAGRRRSAHPRPRVRTTTGRPARRQLALPAYTLEPALRLTTPTASSPNPRSCLHAYHITSVRWAQSHCPWSSRRALSLGPPGVPGPAVIHRVPWEVAA